MAPVDPPGEVALLSDDTDADTDAADTESQTSYMELTDDEPHPLVVENLALIEDDEDDNKDDNDDKLACTLQDDFARRNTGIAIVDVEEYEEFIILEETEEEEIQQLLEHEHEHHEYEHDHQSSSPAVTTTGGTSLMTIGGTSLVTGGTASSLFEPAYIEEVVYEELDYFEEVIEEVEKLTGVEEKGMLIISNTEIKGDIRGGDEQVITTTNNNNKELDSIEKLEPNDLVTGGEQLSSTIKALDGFKNQEQPNGSVRGDTMESSDQDDRQDNQEEQDSNEDKDNTTTDLLDFAPYLDITDDNEAELTERLYGAIHHAFDALDQHYPASFLELNPMIQMMPPNTTNSDDIPLSSDLQWAIKVSMDAVYPEIVDIPQIDNLPVELKDDDVNPAIEPMAPLSSSSESGSDSPMQFLSETPLQVDPEMPTQTATPEVSNKRTEGKEEDEDAPFDENETTERKPPPDVNENDDATPRKQNLGSVSPTNSASNRSQDPQKSSPLLPTTIYADEDANDVQEDRSNPLLPESIHRDDEQAAVAPQSSQQLEGSSSTPSMAEDGRMMEVEHDAVSGVAETPSTPFSPQVTQERPVSSTDYAKSNIQLSKRKGQTPLLIQDVEAQQEETPQFLEKQFYGTEQPLTRSWMDREQEKENVRLERIKHTIRVVLLTLLIVLPFVIGAYLTLSKERNNE